jgi:predicted ATPase
MDDPYYMALLADARIRDGRNREALDAVSEGLALVQESRSFFFDAELHRLRGAALVGLERPGDAEAALEEALAAARRHGTRALELRAAVDLAALWRADGREAEAAALVSGLYGSYTEGLATADLTRARALLTDLGATPA